LVKNNLNLGRFTVQSFDRQECITHLDLHLILRLFHLIHLIHLDNSKLHIVIVVEGHCHCLKGRKHKIDHHYLRQMMHPLLSLLELVHFHQSCLMNNFHRQKLHSVYFLKMAIFLFPILNCR
jgi:hypothetical protein